MLFSLLLRAWRYVQSLLLHFTSLRSAPLYFPMLGRVYAYAEHILYTYEE